MWARASVAVLGGLFAGKPMLQGDGKYQAFLARQKEQADKAPGVVRALANHAVVVQFNPTESDEVALDAKLSSMGVTTVSKGALPGRAMDERAVIDTLLPQASQAAMQAPPTSLQVSAAAQAVFKSKFSIGWGLAAETVVFNAAEYAWLLGLSPVALADQWEQAKQQGRCVHLGGGVDVALLDDGLYAVCAGFPALRQAWTRGSSMSHWREVQWEATKWEEISAEVAGGKLESIPWVSHRSGGPGLPPAVPGAAALSVGPVHAVRDRMVWSGTTDLAADVLVKMCAEAGGDMADAVGVIGAFLSNGRDDMVPFMGEGSAEVVESFKVAAQAP